MIETFNIHIPGNALDDLRERLRKTKWPDEILNSGWYYGSNLSYMKELTDYWIDQFDWRKVEDYINAYPNYIAEIDGIKIHFLHIRTKGIKSIPLIITHGWPGSFLEMMKLIPFLTNDPEFSFDLVIPSMPGYGFSQKIVKTGCNVRFIGELWIKLMKELSYNRFGLQGGDFGAGVNTAIALNHPEQVIGLHLNYVPGSYKPYLHKNENLSSEEIQIKKDSEEWYQKEGAYAHQHMTKPLTLAYALQDSPVGLCAWLIEKFYGWSDCKGNIENVFTKDELLANVCLYWFTETIHSSIRLYNENARSPFYFNEHDFIKIPVGIARFAFEAPFPSRKYIERGYNVQHWTEFPSGGHFAAMEKPELLARDIKEFFNSLTSPVLV